MEQVAKKPRACIPCHNRKVRCDSAVIGTPCTRCTKRGRTAQCQTVPVPERGSNKRKHSQASELGKARAVGNDREPPAEPVVGGRSLGLECLPITTTTSKRTTPTWYTNPPDPDPDPDSRAAPSGRGPSQESPSATAGPIQSPGQSTTVSTIGANALLEASQYSMSEDDAHLQTICRMSGNEAVLLTPPAVGGVPGRPVRHVVEYYSDLNALSLLAEAVGLPNRRRLVQVELPGTQTSSAWERDLSRLDEIDRAFLKQRRVHCLPAKQFSNAIIDLFFKHVYPYTPIVDRTHLLGEYLEDNCSTFLLYAIMAITVPFAPADLIACLGFTSVTDAQREFFTRARILFDFGCEKGQLNLLQGSVFMSSFQNSFAPDKDFRFWFNNAIHIARLMGLHRRNIDQDLDPAMHRVCRRIWWHLVQRDVTFSLAGFENTRLINDDETDSQPLCPDDWRETTFGDITISFPPITNIHIQFSVQNCKLAQLGAQCLRLVRGTEAIPSSRVRDAGDSITLWRKSLPPELSMDGVHQWDESNVWIIVILAFSYRLECLLYHTLRRRTGIFSQEDLDWMNQRLTVAMFQMSTLMRLAMAHEVLHVGPPSMIVCATQLMALQIDLALSPDCRKAQQQVLKAEVHTAISYFRDIGDKWMNAKWATRVFEWAVKRTGMSLTDSRPPCGEGDGPGRRDPSSANVESGGDPSLNVSLGFPHHSDFAAFENVPPLELISDNWLQDMINEGIISGHDQGLFEVFGSSI